MEAAGGYGVGAHTYKGQQISAIPRFLMIPNLTEPDLTPTEVRSPLPAAFGRIEPKAIAFIFARHYGLRPH